MNAPFNIPGSGPVRRFEEKESVGFLPRGWIDGLILSNDTTDATNDISIAAGSARSTVRIVDGSPSTLTRDQMDIELPVSIIKQADVAFAPENYDPEGYSGGGRSGGRSSSSLADGSWHYFLVGGGGLQPDVMIHDSVTQTSVLAEMQKIGAYSAYRHIGSLVRVGGALQAFTQYNSQFLLTTPVWDINHTSDHTSAQTGTLASVPTGVAVEAILSVGVADNNQTGAGTYVSALTQAASSPTNSGVPGVTCNGFSSTVYSWRGNIRVQTNASAQIRYQATNAAVDTQMMTFGWVHPRGRDS